MIEKRILMIDGDPDSRSIYTTVLELQGYRVLQAAHAALALELARERVPDLILLELSLPGAHGGALIQELRQEPRTAATPILVVTAWAFAAAQRVAYTAGCSGFLTKPCPPRVLAAHVRRVLQPPLARSA